MNQSLFPRPSSWGDAMFLGTYNGTDIYKFPPKANCNDVYGFKWSEIYYRPYCPRTWRHPDDSLRFQKEMEFVQAFENLLT